MSWHVPTAAEVAAATALITRFVVPALEALEQGAQALGGGSAMAGGSASAKATYFDVCVFVASGWAGLAVG